VHQDQKHGGLPAGLISSARVSPELPNAAIF
jgi:hypothetical protein